jgi:hypothetical protein
LVSWLGEAFRDEALRAESVCAGHGQGPRVHPSEARPAGFLQDLTSIRPVNLMKPPFAGVTAV